MFLVTTFDHLVNYFYYYYFYIRYQETYDMVRQVVDENGGEMQYTDVAEFLVKQMMGKFHSTDLLLMQVNYIY